MNSVLFQKIERGDIHELSLEILDSFLSVCPKDSEVQDLRNAILALGIFDFKEALQKLHCGKPEEFMLNLLIQKSDLQQKAEILKQIVEMGPTIN